MSSSTIVFLQSPTCACPLTMRRVAAALFVGWVAVATGQTAVAQDCSVAAQGQRVYARVKQKVEAKFSDKDGFTFAPYDHAKITLEKQCDFHIMGRFQYQIMGHINRRIYDATMTPKTKAPGGMKILSYEIQKG